MKLLQHRPSKEFTDHILLKIVDFFAVVANVIIFTKCFIWDEILSSGANVIINPFLQAHLVKYCTESEPPCPLICLEKLVFEMDKSFRETRLQLLLSPILLRSADYAERCSSGAQTAGSEPQLRQGHLLLTGLQFRGHAMFSELDRALGADTLEYGWLMALQCGSLLGTVLAKTCFFYPAGWFLYVGGGGGLICSSTAVLRIYDILVRIRIRGSMPLTNGSRSCYFRHLSSSFSAYYLPYFLKVHLHRLSKTKLKKKSQKARNQGFSYYFCLMMEG